MPWEDEAKTTYNISDYIKLASFNTATTNNNNNECYMCFPNTSIFYMFYLTMLFALYDTRRRCIMHIK